MGWLLMETDGEINDNSGKRSNSRPALRGACAHPGSLAWVAVVVPLSVGLGSHIIPGGPG